MKQMNRIKGRRIIRLLTFLLTTCFVLAFPALASGGGALELQYDRNGVEFQIYRVAEASGSGYALTGAFHGYSVEIPGESWRDAAATLAAYAARDQLVSDASGRTAAGGVAFSGLESGLYLVVGQAASSGGKIYTPVPFLVGVGVSGTATADVKWEESGDGGGGGSNEIDVSVRKVWSGDSAQNRPGSVTVQLLGNGAVLDSVVLSDANGWCHTWKNLNDSCRYQVTEETVPDGYAVSVSQSENTFTVTNSAEGSGGPDAPDEPNIPSSPDDPDDPNHPGDPNIPGTPDEPNIPDTPDGPSNPDVPGDPDTPGLPQTGQFWWPVPVLLVLGGMLVFAGQANCRKGRHD